MNNPAKILTIGALAIALVTAVLVFRREPDSMHPKIDAPSASAEQAATASTNERAGSIGEQSGRIDAPTRVPAPGSTRAAPEKTPAQLEQELKSGAAMSPEELSRVTDRSVWCRHHRLVDGPFVGKDVWWERAQDLCDGLVGTDLSDEVKKVMSDRSSSGQRVRDELAREEETAGEDSAMARAEEIIVSSMDPAAIAHAARYVLRNRPERSIANRVTGENVHPGDALTLESTALLLFSCTLQHDCGPTAYETLNYCLSSQARCPENAPLDIAMRETLAPYTWQRVSAIASFLLTPPIRRFPH